MMRKNLHNMEPTDIQFFMHEGMFNNRAWGGQHKVKWLGRREGGMN